MGIRLAVRRDAATLAALAGGLSHHYLDGPSAPLPGWLADTLGVAAFVQRIESDEYTHLVYEQGGRIAAYLAMQGNSHLYHLFVAEGMQRQGIARQLWQQAMQRCESGRYSVRASLSSVAAYRSLGFAISGELGERDGLRFQPMEYRR